MSFNLALWLQRHARIDDGRPAVYLGATPWKTFGGLARDAAALAGGLRGKLGLAPGDRVALVMANAPEYPEILLGIWWAGLAAVPVNAKLHPREVAYILENSGASAVFVTPDWVKNGIIYQIFPDRFRNGNPANDQDFKELYYQGKNTAPAGKLNVEHQEYYHLVKDWYDADVLPKSPHTPDGRDWIRSPRAPPRT